MEHRKVKITMSGRSAVLSSVNEEMREIEVRFGSDYPVDRYDWNRDEYFSEVLSFNPDHVRMQRLTDGAAPVLDNHNGWNGAAGALGRVMSAELNGDHGTAVLRFADTPDVENTWRKVSTGIIQTVSVGYRVYSYQETGERTADGLPVRLATDWEPYEISVAPMPADPTAKARKSEDCFEARVITTDEDVDDELQREIEEETNSQRDVGTKPHTFMSLSLNDLKASRKAFEDEIVALDAVQQRDDAQDERLIELLDKVDEINADIERKEKIESVKAARIAQDGTVDTGEAAEKAKMKKRFSFSEAVRDVIQRGGVQGVAREMYDHAVSRGENVTGDIAIPGDFIGRAGSADDFQAGSGDGSGFVPTEVGEFVEGLTAPMMFESWGTNVINGASANFQLPKESVKATATAEGEVDAGAASGLELDQTDFSPKRYHSDTTYSKQLLLQGVGGVDTIIANALRRGHDRKVMTDIYSGGGAPAITGLLSLAGNDIANGGANYTDIVLDLETAVLEDHGLTENARYILSPSAYRYLAEAAKVSSVKALIDDGKLNGYDYHKTPYLADASSGVGQIIFGDWSNCYFVRFGGIDLVIDPYGSKDTAQIEITMNQWIDFNLPQTTAFAFENGVTAS